ncbi:MAG: NfeD family protein [Actinomycetota bacterium]|jgi:membrane protein implicated in regulation of membrane protease activity|nr:NfeD family protein [Actinomycetota bacterium]
MDWLRETQWLWWVGAALVLGLIEIASLDLVFTMLAAAALASALAAALGAGFPVQVIVFVTTSVALLALLRPLALRKLKPAGPGERTNAAGHVGRPAEVLREVTDRGGLVKLAGEEWSARTTGPGDILPTGRIVSVVRIEGATAIVEAPADPTEESH